MVLEINFALTTPWSNAFLVVSGALDLESMRHKEFAEMLRTPPDSGIGLGEHAEYSLILLLSKCNTCSVDVV